MKKIIADLHIHTNHSDGKNSPEEIINLALSSQMKAIAISDHDNFEGIAPTVKASQNKLIVIPAVEFSCQIENQDLHILGYFVNYNEPNLVQAVETFRKARETRGIKMAQKLNELGFNFDFQEVANQSLKGGSIGRPHLARVLVNHGYVSSIQEAFEKYLGEKCPAYVPKYKMDSKSAFELIKNAGGISVWAHPGAMEDNDYLEKFVTEGLMGIEVFHPKHDKRDTDRYFNLAKR